MGLGQLREFLHRHSRIALDTSIFIYQLEENPKYVEATHHVFQWLSEPGAMGITSTITMTELLVQPYRDGKKQQAGLSYALLSTYPNLLWIAPNLEIADIAARIRASHRFRTPDALLAATALHVKATGLVTNDRIFKRVTDFQTVVIDDIL